MRLGVVTRRRRFAGGERGSRGSYIGLHVHRDRVRGSKHASRCPFNLFERRYGLAETVERGAGVLVERCRVSRPHFLREFMTLSKNAPRHGHSFAQHRPGFFETIKVV